MKFKVIDKAYTEITKERDPTDEWDADSTYTSHDIRGITVASDEDYSELDSEYYLYPNTDYYLVYGIYSTGDSFSHHEGSIAYVQLYLTKEYAERCAKALEDHNNFWGYRWDENKDLQKERKLALKKDKYAEQHVNIQLESGKYLKYSIPWYGYFEDLTSINVQKVRLI